MFLEIVVVVHADRFTMYIWLPDRFTMYIWLPDFPSGLYCATCCCHSNVTTFWGCDADGKVALPTKSKLTGIPAYVTYLKKNQHIFGPTEQGAGSWQLYGPGPYGPRPLGPYGPGPFMIWKQFLSQIALNMLQDHIWKCTLLQEHVSYMLLEQYAFQIWSWTIWT